MSLKSRVLIITTLVVGLYAVVDYGIQHFVVFPSFVALEENEASTDMARCVQALESEIHNLNMFCYDWSAWDDTYEFVLDGNTEFIESNLADSLYNTGMMLNLICFCDIKGKVVCVRAYNYLADEEELQAIELDEFPKGVLAEDNLLLAHEDVESSVSGIIMTKYGPMMIASRPVLNSDAEGPIHGSIIMGKFLTEEIVQKLAAQTNVDFKIWDLNQGSISADQRSIANNITRQSAFHILEVDENFLEVRAVFNDLKGNSALLMEAKINRDISAKGAAAVKYSLVSIVCAGLFILSVLLVLLQRGVIGPITRLTNHFVTVGHSDDLTTRFSLDRNDEIGTMAKEFDNMVSKLSDARKKLMDQSYTSGMAEMASGLLHNVRNTLTPVTVEIEALSQTINDAPLEQIEMARKELAEGDPGPERKEDLHKFLDAGNKSLVEMVQDIQGKLQNVSTPVAQIERMLAEGDPVSHAQQPMEIFKLDELINDSIALLSRDLKTAASIEFDQRVAEVTVKANRISLLQIINNLLINAAESIQQSETTSGKIEISADNEEIYGSETVHVTVRDNGSGIEPDNLKRIFERGFSTKQDDHSGFGLHWCANTLIAANGRIYAESQGSGQGACLHVMIPNNL